MLRKAIRLGLPRCGWTRLGLVCDEAREAHVVRCLRGRRLRGIWQESASATRPSPARRAILLPHALYSDGGLLRVGPLRTAALHHIAARGCGSCTDQAPGVLQISLWKNSAGFVPIHDITGSMDSLSERMLNTRWAEPSSATELLCSYTQLT